ncbi:PAS fold family [Synechococcus sp. PCC 7335]|uniref:PAS domain-containing sensor histidine kinase n=1 Tax=Synechococcus sp. (strain ATCC 29403 / PCC 7335) TaxID=91464 RepID=UPI00017EBCCC|nr:PAS domain-containing sensor histidine kinase [Synechococcus sp. PCC 7335]EDX83418.1 PAS fold family [Synechococcus sp. PCC 7335]
MSPSPGLWVWLWGAVVAGGLLSGLIVYGIAAHRYQAILQRERERARVIIRQSEEKFRRLVEANLIGVSVGCLDGRILEANQRFLDILGYTREDLKAGAINWIDMTPLKYAEIDRQAVCDQRSLGQCSPFEKEYFRKDGSLVPILMGHAVYDQDQEYTIGFVLDLSDRKRLEALSVLEERSRLARDVHDSLAQAFTSILVHIEVAERKLLSDPTTAQACLQTSAEVAQAGLVDARRTIKALRPYHLDQTNLYDALCQIAHQIFAYSSTQVRSNQSGASYVLLPEVENALLRIGQEALTNAFKHAQATVIYLNLSYQPNQCVLRIQDNGIGFATDAAERANGTSDQHSSVQHYGLTGMAERSQHIDAELTVESILNQGTAITVSVQKSLA